MGYGIRKFTRAALSAAAGLVMLLGAAGAAQAERTPPMTPSGWRVDPAGVEFGVSHIDLGFQGPIGAALSPDGRRLLAASSGATRWQSADLFDIDARLRTGVVFYPAGGQSIASVFYGVAWAPDGRHAYVSGGGQRVVHVLAVQDGQLTEERTFPTTGFAAGIAYGQTPLGPRLYVVNNTIPPLGRNTPGHSVTVIDPVSGQSKGDIELGVAAQPLGVAFARDGRTAIVTNWIGRSISVIDTVTGQAAPQVLLSPDPLQADHPSAVEANPRRDEAYVANANSDTVSVVDSRTGEVSATIPIGLVSEGPKGAIPDGLAVAPDGRTLFVALAGENAVAVVDLDARALRGFIPTSWYPADVEITPDGQRLVVTNTNDSGAGPNRCGPTSPLPECDDVPGETQSIARMVKGSVQVVDVPTRAGELQSYANAVEHNNRAQARGREKPGMADAIEHVFYVIKENRTYDQVLGDLPDGNGDPALTLFTAASAPNHHALASRFGILDNYYADAEVTSDGHAWATQASSTDYVDKLWPFEYSPARRDSTRGSDYGEAVAYPAELLPSDPLVARPAAAQTVGYLWDNAWAHGVSYRIYGEQTGTGDCKQPPAVRKNESSLTHAKGVYSAQTYPGYNMSCSDHRDRIPAWLEEFKSFVEGGNLPALNIMRLSSDHTSGTSAGQATPEAYMADNDLALGRLVDAVSHSRYWKDSVIFVTEDDAQNGPDHVDAHRTVGLVISAYNKHAAVDSTHYDTASMVATIEDLLELPPMSITDARAARMWKLFRDDADLTPYDALTPDVVAFGDPDAPINGVNAPMAAASETWDFSREDATPEIALNQAIWKSVKGRDSRMPHPKHSRIGVRPNDEGDEN